MTTFATHERPLQERVRDAWTAYRAGLAGLEGREYEAAEARSWDELQETLRAIDAGRDPGAGTHPDPGA